MKQLLPSIFAALCTSQSFAMPITLNSQWVGGSLSQEVIDLTFTYEDTTPDSYPDPGLGVYIGSLYSLTMSYDDTIWSLNGSQENRIILSNMGGPTAFRLVAGLVSNTGQFANMTFNMETNYADRLPQIDLADFLDDLKVTETALIIGNFGVAQQVGGVKPGFTEVPEPGLAFLVIPGLVGFGLMRRRSAR